MKAPRVTIGMPVYNSRPAHFYQALRPLLAQDFEDFELIISDNESVDPAREMYLAAARLDRRIRYVRHEKNHGSAFNFNYLVSVAAGEYFMWAADDDIRRPGFVGRAVRILDDHRSVVSVSSLACLIDVEGRRIEAARFDRNASSPSLFRRVASVVSPHNCLDIYGLHRIEALRKTNLAAPIPGPDTVILLELLLQGPMERIEDELFCYRSAGQMDDLQGAYTRVVGSDKLGFDPRLFQRDCAVILLRRVARAELPFRQRVLCAGSLIRKILAERWLTTGPLRLMNAEIKRRVREGRYVGATALLGSYICLSPMTLLRRSFWRALIQTLRGQRDG
jgi:glycosyltransferase involved in cell wall biosynthesis